MEVRLRDNSEKYSDSLGVLTDGTETLVKVLRKSLELPPDGTATLVKVLRVFATPGKELRVSQFEYECGLVFGQRARRETALALG